MSGATKAQIYDFAMRVAVPILLGVSAWTFTQLWSHEGRLTSLEVRSEIETKQIKQDLSEIKADVKRLLVSRGGDPR